MLAAISPALFAAFEPSSPYHDPLRRPGALPTPHDQYRTGGVVHHTFRHAAQEEAFERPVATTTHHDELGAHLFREVEDHVHRGPHYEVALDHRRADAGDELHLLFQDPPGHFLIVVGVDGWMGHALPGVHDV